MTRSLWRKTLLGEMGWWVSANQRRAVPSRLPVKIQRPSGLYWALNTQSLWLSVGRTSRAPGLDRSQTWALLSAPAVTRLEPSRLKLRSWTHLAWASGPNRGFPVNGSQTQAWLSAPPVARRFPPRLKAMALILAVC